MPTGREKEQIYWWESEGNRPTAAFDLDGTVLSYKPGMASSNQFGWPYPGVVSEMRKLWKDGWKIIIWTCRGRSQELVDHLVRCNIPFDEINVNTSGPHDSPKIYADVYVDDKAITFDGKTEGLAERIKNHRPWHEKK
jgi:hypothetical protein